MNVFNTLLTKIRLKMIMRIRGNENILKIAGSIKKQSKIRINGNNNTVVIENGKYKNLQINISGDNHHLIIESSEHISDLQVIMQNFSNKIHIGKNTYTGGTRLIACGINNSITIGESCLISDNVEFWGCDGHSIVQDGQVVNHSKPIEIASHVWIGSSVKILKGTKIGENSIIGMGSLIAGKEYPSNVLIVGSPGKVVKKNINWTVENLEV